jgi:hypothetical protein
MVFRNFSKEKIMLRFALAATIVATFCSLSPAQTRVPVPHYDIPMTMPDGRKVYVDPWTGNPPIQFPPTPYELMMQEQRERQYRESIVRDVTRRLEFELRRPDPMPRQGFGGVAPFPIPPINPEAKYPSLARIVGLVHKNIPDNMSKQELDHVTWLIGMNLLDSPHISVHYKGKQIYDPALNPLLKRRDRRF